MSIVSITDVRIATRTHLETIANNIATDYEGDKFTPDNDVPYQSVHLLTGSVDDFTISHDDNSQSHYILQITLKYPSQVGMFKIEEKAEDLIEHFKRGTKLTKNAIIINIDKTPTVTDLGVEGDRQIKAVSIVLNVFK